MNRGVALPYIKNHVQNPYPDAPSARSAADARRAPHLSSGPAVEGGVAASDAGTPAHTIPPQRRGPLLPGDIARVIATYPAELTTVVQDTAGSPAPRGLVTAIRGQLAERTPEQLADRVARRWHTHGHAARHADGALDRPVGVAIALVRAGECGNARCEDGTDLDTSAPCRACPQRRADRRNPGQVTPADQPASTRPGREQTAGPCPGCGLPATGGAKCTACLNRDRTDHEDSAGRGDRDADQALAPTQADGERSAENGPCAPGGPERPRCTRCHTRTGRDRWAGLCGPCRATS